MAIKKYDWDKLLKEQSESGMSVKGYCKKYQLNQSSFYKQKNKRMGNPKFSEVKVEKEPDQTIKKEEMMTLKINETAIEIPVSLLEVVIRGIK